MSSSWRIMENEQRGGNGPVENAAVDNQVVDNHIDVDFDSSSENDPGCWRQWILDYGSTWLM